VTTTTKTRSAARNRKRVPGEGDAMVKAAGSLRAAAISLMPQSGFVYDGVGMAMCAAKGADSAGVTGPAGPAACA
jgi:hypothetical protein